MRPLILLGFCILQFSIDLSAAALIDVGNLSTPRYEPTIFLLPDGRIVVIGGRGIDVLDPTAFFEPTVIPTEVPIGAHAAVALRDGRILIAGGGYTGVQGIDIAEGGNNRVEVYDPSSNDVRLIGRMNEARMGAQATLLADGRVLITGGWRWRQSGRFVFNDVTASADIYDPATGAIRPAGSMRSPRYDHTATQLDDGCVLIAGGRSHAPYPAWPPPVDTTEIFDPATETFADGPAMHAKRFGHTATRLTDGRVLIAGGLVWPVTYVVTPSNPSTELFDPSTNALEIGPDLEMRWDHTATLLLDGRVLLFGGGADAIVYDPKTDRIVERAALGHQNRRHDAALLPDGSVLITGGDADVLRFVPYVPSRRRAVR